ncbi:unnamed protein product [Ixodes pacificus]
MNTEPHLVFMRNKKHFTIKVNGPEVVSTDCLKQLMLKQAQHCVSKVKVACFDKQGKTPCLSIMATFTCSTAFPHGLQQETIRWSDFSEFWGRCLPLLSSFRCCPWLLLAKNKLAKKADRNESKFSLKKTVCVNCFAVLWAIVEFILKII